MTLLRILVCLCLSAALTSVSGCREKSQLYCSTTQACEVGLPVCDLEGVCAASDHIANTCILEACWDAGPSPFDAAQGGGIDASSTDIDAGIDVCDQELVCPGATAGNSTLCGVITTIADSERLIGDGTSTLCDPEAPTATGPCAIQLKVFDMLAYSGNPGGAQEIVPGSVKVDGCGRYIIENLKTPGLGFAAVVADDYDGQDLMVRSSGVALIAGGISTEFDLLVLDQETDDRWTTTAGTPFGSASFSQVGATLITFRTLAGPQAGVKITRAAVVNADDDYYFFDALPTSRFQVRATQDTTGANGAALLVNFSTLETHGGSGSEPTDCTWSTALLISIPGVLVYFNSIAEDADGNPC